MGKKRVTIIVLSPLHIVHIGTGNSSFFPSPTPSSGSPCPNWLLMECFWSAPNIFLATWRPSFILHRTQNCCLSERGTLSPCLIYCGQKVGADAKVTRQPFMGTIRNGRSVYVNDDDDPMGAHCAAHYPQSSSWYAWLSKPPSYFTGNQR